MTRGLHNDVVNSLANQTHTEFLMARIQTVGGDYRITTLPYDITFESATWSGLGSLIGLETLTESSDSIPTGFNLLLSGIDPNNIYMALALGLQNATITLYIRSMNLNGTILSEHIGPILGIVDKYPIEATETDAVLRLECISEYGMAMRTAEKLFSDSDQKSLYPGDRFFEHASNIERFELRFLI